MMHFDRCV